jgi:hypothetical protein
VIGVDEHAWRHTRRGDKYVTVIIDLTGIRAGTGPARLLDMVEGASSSSGFLLATAPGTYGPLLLARQTGPVDRQTGGTSMAAPSMARSLWPPVGTEWNARLRVATRRPHRLTPARVTIGRSRPARLQRRTLSWTSRGLLQLVVH